MIATRALALAAAAAAGLAGCAELQPFETHAPPPAAGRSEAGPRVAICYDRLVSSLARVQAAAQAQCPAKTLAIPVGTDWYLEDCPLLLPARGVFVCAPAK